MSLSLKIYQEKKLDVYLMFPEKSSIVCPPELWLPCVLSSLKRKHQVLVQESPGIPPSVMESSQRWKVGENWIWFSPRCRSFLIEVYSSKTLSYPELKALLQFTK
jgi:hypothetical protein